MDIVDIERKAAIQQALLLFGPELRQWANRVSFNLDGRDRAAFLAAAAAILMEEADKAKM